MLKGSPAQPLTGSQMQGRIIKLAAALRQQCWPSAWVHAYPCQSHGTIYNPPPSSRPMHVASKQRVSHLCICSWSNHHPPCVRGSPAAERHVHANICHTDMRHRQNRRGRTFRLTNTENAEGLLKNCPSKIISPAGPKSADMHTPAETSRKRECCSQHLGHGNTYNRHWAHERAPAPQHKYSTSQQG